MPRRTARNAFIIFLAQFPLLALPVQSFLVNPSPLPINAATASFSFLWAKVLTCNNDDDSTTTAFNAKFSDDLIESLDLSPLMRIVSLHAGTRRGRQAFLALTGDDYNEKSTASILKEKTAQTIMSARSRRAMGEQAVFKKRSDGFKETASKFSIAIATNAVEANQEFHLVAQAIELLKPESNLSFPPLYGVSSSPFDTGTIAETDYDSFMRLLPEEATLEQIIHAEKVIETIRNVKNWGKLDIVQQKAPQLAEMADSIDYKVLAPLYDDIAETVVIKRVRTLTDPTGRSSFQFELNANKFHVIQVLRSQVQDMAEKVRNDKFNGSPSMESELSVLVDKLEATEEEIQSALLQSILGRSKEIDASLNILARLDVIFAKAAFGLSTGGLIPEIRIEGTVLVEQFVHPILLLSESEGKPRDVVAIDLRLSSEEEHRALIISGPNGGGKTAAMKSFGLAVILCKVGLPIPCRPKSDTSKMQTPRIDFFRDVHVALGDRQSLVDGESTMMARLNACASVIEKVGSNAIDEAASLVLIDEIGGGTDPDAGGAIAQAILEKLLETRSCHVVATTHVPRLKVLSYNSKQFACATVLLEANIDDENGDLTNDYQKPAFELFYDSIGDSYVLGAASRCMPALPGEVLSRAAQLMADSASASPDGTKDTFSADGAYAQVLTESIKRQSERAQLARKAAERHEQDSRLCRGAMLSLAAAYDREFLFLQQKLEYVYSKLKQKEADRLDVVGGTLEELRLVRKEVKSQSQLLKEKGLKLVPDWHELMPGDSVVIVSEDDLNGVSATVHSDTGSLSLGPDDVAVLPSLAPWNDDSSRTGEVTPLILKRFQVAIWDYDSIWADDNNTNGGTRVTSVNDSKRRLNDILLNIKKSNPTRVPTNDHDSSSSSNQKCFTSSRERKASSKQSANSNKKQKRKR